MTLKTWFFIENSARFMLVSPGPDLHAFREERCPGGRDSLPGNQALGHNGELAYTVGDRDPDNFEEVLTETRYFLYNIGVDGLFTNNPDIFPRTAS